MDNLEPKTDSPALSPQSQPDLAGVQEQLGSLQHLVVSMLVLVLAVSSILALYMHRQAKMTRGELDAIRPQAEAINAQFQRVNGPGLDDLARKLAEYGAKDPEFAPIMAKYGLARPAATGAPPAAIKAPAPAAPAVPAPAKK